jgi:putative component of membrane protein insertase Oxa1/YidC/SpoIIIJ protein YidD
VIALNAHQRLVLPRVARRFGRLEGGRGALLGSLAIALHLCPLPARAEGPTARVSFTAPFALEMGGRGPVERSSGTVAFLPDGSVCIRVASPIQQELHFAHDEVVVYYPDRDLALRSKVEPGTAPPLLDAVLAGVVDPASTIPKTSKMLEQKRHEEELRTRWKLIDAEGRDLGEMRTVETREGGRQRRARRPERQDAAPPRLRRKRPPRRPSHRPRHRRPLLRRGRQARARGEVAARRAARDRARRRSLRTDPRDDQGGGARPARLLAAALALVAFTTSARADGRDLSEPSQAVALLLGSPAQRTAPAASADKRWEGSLGKAAVRTLFVVYRKVLSSQDAPVCAFAPSCSHFSERAVEQCGFVEGVLLSADRLVRDHPLATALYRTDPKTGRLLDAPERYCLRKPKR